MCRSFRLDRSCGLIFKPFRPGPEAKRHRSTAKHLQQTSDVAIFVSEVNAHDHGATNEMKMY